MIELATFLLAFMLAIPSLAAAYRFLDLGYDLRRHWARAAASLSLWIAIHLFALIELPGSLTTAYAAGLVSFVSFHVLVYFFLRAWVHRIFRRPTLNADDS